VTPVRTITRRAISSRYAPALYLHLLGTILISGLHAYAQDLESQFGHASNPQNTLHGLGTLLPAARSPLARITVLVFDYAGVPAGPRERAEAEAAYVMSRAGVESDWVDCGGTSAGSSQDERCRPLFDSMTLCVRLVSDSGEKRPKDVLGFASLQPPPQQGVYATVFYSRVEAAAAEFGVDAYEVLGCAMAHEVGHLLLGSQSHAARGLMRAQWSRGDFVNAAQRCLRFSGSESAQLQAQVETRRARLRGPVTLAAW
jgi:hypothetical protein